MFDGFIKAACATPEIVVADCAHNAQKIIDLMEQAAQAEVKLLVFPELGADGIYLRRSCFFSPHLSKRRNAQLLEIIDASEPLDMAVVVGVPDFP